MTIRESEKFVKQVVKLSKSNSCSRIEKDVERFKDNFLPVAFDEGFAPTNKPLYEVPVPGMNCVRKIWRIYISNSNNNKGKKAGYRIFYCKAEDEDVILLFGIAPKQNIRDESYKTMVQDLLGYITEKDWLKK